MNKYGQATEKQIETLIAFMDSIYTTVANLPQKKKLA